jgi:hypothetical protein
MYLRHFSTKNFMVLDNFEKKCLLPSLDFFVFQLKNLLIWRKFLTKNDFGKVFQNVSTGTCEVWFLVKIAKIFKIAEIKFLLGIAIKDSVAKDKRWISPFMKFNPKFGRKFDLR